ncbi:MAG: PadR family transcriptional regulator, partial [Methylocella sp.]
MRFPRHSHCRAQGEAATGGGSRERRPFGLFGGRRRMFDQGDIRLVILKLISEKPSHGYEIIKATEDRLGGAYSPSPGIVYPALTLLYEQGLIRVESTDGPRKLYAITPEGETVLERNRA